jgi:DNA-binding PadR family transcriptional regulator
MCKILRCGPGTLYPELAILEDKGLIVARWVSMGDDRPRRRYYRIATPDERADHKRQRAGRRVKPVPVPRRRRLLWGTAWQPGDAS